MAQGNDGDDNRNADSLAEETTLTSPPLKLPTLPFDLLPEILCRLPVKLLVQLRCLCKFFNSLISDPKFAKKHLQLSTKRHHLMLTNAADDDELVMYDSPIPSILSPSTVFTQTQLYLPSTLPNELYNKKVLCCCDGMFCGELNIGSYFLWNPSIAKFKLLPPLENPGQQVPFTISFGYDHSIDNYKVVAVSHEFEVCVYTLGTDYWREIEEMPYYDRHSSGIFACGTVNWISSTGGCWDVIISLDLEEESYQELYPPDFGDENDSWELGVLRDCLCVFASSDEYWDVWIMKEYGNEESWTNLYTIPNELLYIKSLQDQDLVADAALYVSENDQLLVQCYELDDMQRRDNMKLVVYDSETGTLNIPEFQNNYEHTDAIVYIESLISP